MIVSPGRTAWRETDWFLVIFVDDESRTFTALPEVSVRTIVRPLTLATVPTEALPPPGPAREAGKAAVAGGTGGA